MKYFLTVLVVLALAGMVWAESSPTAKIPFPVLTQKDYEEAGITVDPQTLELTETLQTDKIWDAQFVAGGGGGGE